MGWVYLDDAMPDNPKVDGLSDSAFRLWINLLCYCNKHDTRGRVDELSIKKSGTSSQLPANLRRTSELVSAGLLDESCSETHVYEIHDYNIYQGKSVEKARKRKRDRERMRKKRGADGHGDIRDNSGDKVATKKRQSPPPLTHTHTQPPSPPGGDDEVCSEERELLGSPISEGAILDAFSAVLWKVASKGINPASRANMELISNWLSMLRSRHDHNQQAMQKEILGEFVGFSKSVAGGRFVIQHCALGAFLKKTPKNGWRDFYLEAA